MSFCITSDATESVSSLGREDSTSATMPALTSAEGLESSRRCTARAPDWVFIVSQSEGRGAPAVMSDDDAGDADTNGDGDGTVVVNDDDNAALSALDTVFAAAVTHTAETIPLLASLPLLSD